MDLEQRVAELEQLVQEQGRKIAALEVEAQKQQFNADDFMKDVQNHLPATWKMGNGNNIEILLKLIAHALGRQDKESQ